MTRIFLTYVLPLLLPTLIYMAWVGYARKKHDNDDTPPALRKGPLFWCLLAGFMLMAGGLISIALMSGDPPDSGQCPERHLPLQVVLLRAGDPEPEPSPCRRCGSRVG